MSPTIKNYTDVKVSENEIRNAINFDYKTMTIWRFDLSKIENKISMILSIDIDGKAVNFNLLYSNQNIIDLFDRGYKNDVEKICLLTVLEYAEI